MSTTREKVEELLADVLPRIEALKAEALDEIGRVKEDASATTARYEEAARELAAAEEEAEVLRAEREELPDRAYIAGMDEDYALEDELKERYKNLKPAIEHLEERRAALSAEMAELLPNSYGHRNDARIHHTARVAGTAHEERAALKDLRDRLVKALDDAAEPAERVHNDTRALVEAWSMDREWDPAFREKAYGQRRAG